MDCVVVVEAAVAVYDVESSDEAVRIAVSKTGRQLNPDLSHVEIGTRRRTSPSGEELPPAFVAADEALVALELEMEVYDVEHDEHAARVARKEIGQRLENVPLEVVEVREIERDDDADGEDDTDDRTPDDPRERRDAMHATPEIGGEEDPGDGERLLPEFDDMVDE